MRRILLIAALGACAALSGCDQGQQQTAQTTAPTAPVCACRPTAPQETAAAAQPAMPVVQRHRRRHARYAMAWSGHRRWHAYTRTDFTESVLAPYNYVSGSSVSYIERDSGYAGYPAHARRETIAATMTGARLDPWHGYDVDCPRH